MGISKILTTVIVFAFAASASATGKNSHCDNQVSSGRYASTAAPAKASAKKPAPTQTTKGQN